MYFFNLNLHQMFQWLSPVRDDILFEIVHQAGGGDWQVFIPDRVTFKLYDILYSRLMVFSLNHNLFLKNLFKNRKGFFMYVFT